MSSKVKAKSEVKADAKPNASSAPIAKFKAMSVQEVDAAIASIARRGLKLDADIQGAALAILQHVHDHREVSLVQKIFNAMPKGARRNSLAHWFVRFGEVAVNTDKESAKVRPFLFAKDRSTNLAGAETMPWYAAKEEKALAEEFNFAGQLAALLKRATEAQSSGKKLVGAEVLAKVQAALS